MPDIQMVITDMDETFMYEGGIVPEENVRALKEAQEKGVRVLACTGRSWAMCGYLVRSFGFDQYAVTSNGAATIDIQTGQMFDPCVVEPRFVEPIVQAALLDGCKVDLFCGAWIHTCTEHKGRWLQKAEDACAGRPLEERIKVKQWDSMEEMLSRSREQTELIRVEVEVGAPVPPHVAQTMEELGEFHLSVSYPGHWDICNPKAGKEVAAQRLARQFGIEREHIMAIGDSSNDIGMIRWAGLGIAMDNAVPEVKAAADAITGCCEEGGFAQALRRYIR